MMLMIIDGSGYQENQYPRLENTHYTCFRLSLRDLVYCLKNFSFLDILSVESD